MIAPSLTWATPLGSGAVLLAGIALVILLALRAHRERMHPLILVLRVASVLLLLGILVGPEVPVDTETESSQPNIVLLVDQSLSMTTPDATTADGDACSRFDALRQTWLDPDIVAQLSDIAAVRFLAFDARTRPADLARLNADVPTGDQTRLGRALELLLRNAGIDDIVLLSDGVDTDGAPLTDLAGEASAADTRVHVVVPGQPNLAPDASIMLAAQADVVYAGQSTSLRVSIMHRHLSGMAARVLVRERGDDGPIILDDVVTLGRDAAVDVEITPTLQDGTDAESIEYVATIEPAMPDIDTSNNARRTFVRVTGKQIRVCIFEGAPYWDTTFLARILRDDPQFDVTAVHALGIDIEDGVAVPRVHVVRESDDDVLWPSTDAELAEFDVILLGRGIESFFPGIDARLLTRYVTERGGALVFLRGATNRSTDPDAMRMREILDEISPVTWGDEILPGGHAGLTPEGMRRSALGDDTATPRAFADLPNVLATTVAADERALTSVWLRRTDDPNILATDTDPAIVAYASVGRGRVLAVLSDGLWRWAFLPRAMRTQAGVYRLFWSRTIRWLAMGGEFLPGQSVSLTPDRIAARPGDTIGLRMRTRTLDPSDTQPIIRIEHDGQIAERVRLTRSASDPTSYVGAFTPPTEGVYLLTLDDDEQPITARVAVYEDRPELLDTATRRAQLEALSTQTGGLILPLDDIQPLVDALQIRRSAVDAPQERQPVWDLPVVFGGIVLLLGVEWFLRRRQGLR
ncbi:MAG: vWA domain-containing protein [Planctomycetota bacterium]